MTEMIRDRMGLKLGEIRDCGNMLEARSNLGILLARYDKKENKTKDLLGLTIAQGNVLSSYFWDAD